MTLPPMDWDAVKHEEYGDDMPDTPTEVPMIAYPFVALKEVYGEGAPGLSPDELQSMLTELQRHRAAQAARTAQTDADALQQERTVIDHKWFDPVCHETGCHSLSLTLALKRLSFAAQTTGSTAGPDAELQAAIEQAGQALEPWTRPTGRPAWAGEGEGQIPRRIMGLIERALELAPAAGLHLGITVTAAPNRAGGGT